MSTKLVTNQDKLLEEVINNILPKSASADFLVGYFYFSGFEQLYRQLKDKKIKILVGMDVEKTIRNKVKEFELLETVNASRGDIRNNYYRSFVQLCNDTDFFDSREKIEAFRIYLEKIKNGTLEIRKTVEPNHAKLYLFQYMDSVNEQGFNPGVMITGSSNLTFSGMAGRKEMNVVLRDAHSYEEGKKFFDALWEKAVNIASIGNLEEFKRNVEKKVWIDNLYSPFLMYVRVLDELFSKKKESDLRYPSEITEKSYFNLKYQIDAVDSATSIIKKHGGVIISDVVGLGKSIVASALAYNLGLQTVVIAPPHLMDQWITFEYEFRFNGYIHSSGNIKKALEMHDDDKEKLIIIDEAHKYRNEATESYGLLHRLCQGNKVILLTATPFNNRPQDIFSMIKLFQIPAKSTLQVVENLILEFKNLVQQYKTLLKIQKAESEPQEKINDRIKKLANKIRNILAPLLIRRTRLDLMEIDSYRKDLERQNIAFPKVADPIDVGYDLGDLNDLYLDTLEKLSSEDESKSFSAARYKPVTFLKDFQKYRDRISSEFGEEKLFKQAQVNVAKFMRRLLVSRFESSIYAFEKTLNYMIESSKIMVRWIDDAKQVPIFKKGYIPDVADVMPDDEAMFSEELWEDILERNIEALRKKGYEFIPANELKVSFKNTILKDIKILERVRDKWFNDHNRVDPKLDRFAEVLRAKLEAEPNRKLVVFSSYADTANYLYEKLEGSFRVFKYTGADASPANKKIIKQNFDAGWKQPSDLFDVLIATDAISEGYNLHRAGAIFNYDIPYNPTRVIQRVGRINRINKKVFDELYIYNFFPTDIGEKETGTKRISTLKKAMIDALLGEDTKILTSDEELQSYFTEEIRKRMSDQEELSWDTPYIKLLDRLIAEQSETVEQARRIPTRARVRRSVQKDVSGVLVFGRKGEDYVFKFGDKGANVITVTAAEALEFFDADPGEEPQQVSDGFEPVYQHVKKHLFRKITQVPVDKGKREARDKLRVIIKQMPHDRDYLEDLNHVVAKLDGLPERYMRMIRGISFDNLEQDFKEFKLIVPHRYLIAIINKAKKVEEGDECLILSEELI
jgi:superfamily II DNA or RNA helicase